MRRARPLRELDGPERLAIQRIQRRVRVLLAVALVGYLGFVSWLLGSGYLHLMGSTPIQPQALVLYLALVVLAAAPLALRFLYSRHLVQSLAQMAAALRQARDQARQGSQAKADFLATMSHEIRTPMHAVIGFSELLGKTPLDPAQAEYVSAIRESGTHLMAIINDVLDYSKIEAGRIELDEQAFEPVPLAQSCMKAVSLAAEKKGLEMGLLALDGTPQALFGDAPRLRQVLLNLLSNAVKFTDKGDILVTIGAQPQRDGSYVVRFDVRDSGVGIPKSEVPRLFQAFTQADSSSTRRQDGTGLGLAISRRLCELMGGTLTVSSREGKGSVFTATIRAAAAPVPPRLRVRPPEALRGMRLLVVDHNPMNRTILSRNGQAWGMRVRATGDPEEALAWVRAGDPFDMAILDHHLPGLDGVALAKAIRDAGRSMPALLLASSARDPPKGGPGSPFDAVIRKPFLASELVEALRACLAQPLARLRPVGKAALRDKDRKDSPYSRLRILLVEDNVMNQRLALKVLETLGCRAEVAKDGREAVEAVLRHRYDVVLMDVQMPVMDGLEATRAICRQLPPGVRPYTIGLSANALAGERERCLGAGMDDYLPKPMDQDRLASLLRMVEARTSGIRRRVPRRPSARPA